MGCRKTEPEAFCSRLRKIVCGYTYDPLDGESTSLRMGYNCAGYTHTHTCAHTDIEEKHSQTHLYPVRFEIPILLSEYNHLLLHPLNYKDYHQRKVKQFQFYVPLLGRETRLKVNS